MGDAAPVETSLRMAAGFRLRDACTGPQEHAGLEAVE